MITCAHIGLHIYVCGKPISLYFKRAVSSPCVRLRVQYFSCSAHKWWFDKTPVYSAWNFLFLLLSNSNKRHTSSYVVASNWTDCARDDRARESALGRQPNNRHGRGARHANVNTTLYIGAVLKYLTARAYFQTSQRRAVFCVLLGTSRNSDRAKTGAAAAAGTFPRTKNRRNSPIIAHFRVPFPNQERWQKAVCGSMQPDRRRVNRRQQVVSGATGSLRKFARIGLSPRRRTPSKPFCGQTVRAAG